MVCRLVFRAQPSSRVNNCGYTTYWHSTRASANAQPPSPAAEVQHGVAPQPVLLRLVLPVVLHRADAPPDRLDVLVGEVAAVGPGEQDRPADRPGRVGEEGGVAGVLLVAAHGGEGVGFRRHVRRRRVPVTGGGAGGAGRAVGPGRGGVGVGAGVDAGDRAAVLDERDAEATVGGRAEEVGGLGEVDVDLLGGEIRGDEQGAGHGGPPSRAGPPV
ncbi:hypothetical protein CXF45_05230 [Corynebacterium bovis]|uniref:Uncharacterized protein n=1 Tax=Corynebacterium bovis TaxID=36808 RepID=A0A3R8R1D9_9CORY|nr:hypothetical protein CXF36_08635 [Corynebacterium bovis]RRO81199.1 hypothetical protein CXF38_04585 [Corynebacterium bovis]RRO81217.1 hypothetical protein CXF37_07945 [Corynebacterium bovis]RRO86058.1 hypothetical protein CXF48_08190 [Corynebacterium bovis]RRO89222.1 hypothetical protein CXF30_03820 [Corynebacterium bovis]